MVFSSYKNLSGPLPRGIGLHMLQFWFLGAPAGWFTHIYISKSRTAFLPLNGSGCQGIFLQQLYTFWMNMLYSIGLKHLGGKFLINKSHSWLSYLLCTTTYKGVPPKCLFCKNPDSPHSMCKLFLCDLKTKLLVSSDSWLRYLTQQQHLP